MDDGVYILHVDAHSQSNGGKYYPYNTIWLGKTGQDDLLIVLHCTSMEHPKKLIITYFLSSKGIIRTVT